MEDEEEEEREEEEQDEEEQQEKEDQEKRMTDDFDVAGRCDALKGCVRPSNGRSSIRKILSWDSNKVGYHRSEMFQRVLGIAIAVVVVYIFFKIWFKQYRL